ncbi:DUF5684 domain-containing protein [Pseudolysinimonas sp.]|uniref:DUF5684 domain-containing protein n=1 Tax=Pseudolysinimonas sp. TaxID=2680009 RepID=UPI003F7F95B0
MDYDPGYGVGAGAVIAIAIAYVAFVLLVVAGVYVLQAVGFMMLFKKVGIEPWIAWVPYYNTWKLLELGSQPPWIVLIALIPGGSVVLLVFFGLAAYRIGISFGKDASWTVLAVIFGWLWAMLLGRQHEVYDPRRLQAAGYPPPNAGIGSVPRPGGVF